jgi:glucokinase
VDLLPGWVGFPLTERLRQEFCIEVVMENDADAAALAEAEWGVGRDANRFLYVTVGTGIGVAIVVDGRPYRGAGGWHPEAGHHTIDPAGPTCYCGARGCWESLASGPAMVAWTRTNATSADGLPEALGAREVCALARLGHALARRAVLREAHYLAVGLANLITIFCPDRIALGGGVMGSADILLPEILKEAAGWCGLVPFDPAGITRAALGDDAPLLGAARVWQYRTASSLKAQP